jgi:NADPH:quinone reductase
VNQLDPRLRDFNMGFLKKLPAVIGYDIVGMVVKAGKDVTSFPTGSHVFAQASVVHPACGGLQEYTIVNSQYSAIVPHNIKDIDAAVFPTCTITSALGMFSSMGFDIPFPGTPESGEFDYKSQKIVIVGGGTNTGKFAIQLARIAGIGTIIAVAGLSGEAVLKGLGATHVVDRHAPDIESQVREMVGDELLYVYDTFNSTEGLLQSVKLLSRSKKGKLVRLVRGPSVDSVTSVGGVGFEEKQIIGFSSGIPAFGVMFWNKLPLWIDTGELKTLKYAVVEGLHAEKVNAALDDLKSKSGQRWHVSIEAC